MKRFVIAVLLLFCMAVGTLICTARSLNADIADVRLTEITHQGDIAAAEGLTVISQSSWNDHLVWTTAHTLGHAEDAITEAEFHVSYRHSSGGRQPEPFFMSAEIPNGIDFSAALQKTGMSMHEASSGNFDIASDEGTFREFATDPSIGIAAAYNALYMDAPLNEEVRATVHLRDYYDYYPVSLHLQLPGVIWTNNEVSPNTVAEPGTEAYVVQYFREYFKISMLDEVIEIHLTRRSNGMNWGSGSGDCDTYSFQTYSAINDTDCYFTFGTRTNREKKTVDISEIRGGYGIYRLPYRKGTSTTDIGIDVDAMEMVYPLEPGTELEGLYLNTDKTCLLLVTKTDETTVQIDIIDPVSYTCLQSFSVSGIFFRNLRIFEDYTVAVTADKLMVLTEEDGVYTHAFTADIPADADGDTEVITSDHAMAFDGTRLAVVSNAAMQHSGYTLCGYDVMILTADGLLWRGTVENTLDRGTRRNYHSSSFDITPFYAGEALTVLWE